MDEKLIKKHQLGIIVDNNDVKSQKQAIDRLVKNKNNANYYHSIAKKNYTWNDFKTWIKGSGFIKNKKKSLHVVAIDYGIKKNILRYFSDFNCKVTIVSCKTSANDILELNVGHFLISHSLYTGLKDTILKFMKIIDHPKSK